NEIPSKTGFHKIISPYFSKLKFKYSNNTTQKKKTYLN
ncbi:hypothetical protein M085_4531, partial [Bacteroides fragilis str. 3986 N(B)19]